MADIDYLTVNGYWSHAIFTKDNNVIGLREITRVTIHTSMIYDYNLTNLPTLFNGVQKRLYYVVVNI